MARMCVLYWTRRLSRGFVEIKGHGFRVIDEGQPGRGPG